MRQAFGHESCVAPAELISIALHLASRPSFNNCDRFIALVDVARQRSPWLKLSIASTYADRTEPTGKKIPEMRSRRQFVHFGTGEAHDGFRITGFRVGKAAVQHHEIFLYEFAGWDG